jgi:hypothetical protein
MALHGTSKRYIVQRLEREGHTALLEAVQSGQITALTAATSLGWAKRPPLLGGSTHRAHQREFRLREARGELGPAQKMELIYGPSSAMGSYFESREALQAAWVACRDELLARANPGRRPLGWWQFERGDIEHPGYFRERSALWRAGVLSEAERLTLEDEWRQEFAAAQRMSAPERREHHEHHDIPAELIEQWQGARRKRAKRSPPMEVPSDTNNAPAAGPRTGVAALK